MPSAATQKLVVAQDTDVNPTLSIPSGKSQSPRYLRTLPFVSTAMQKPGEEQDTAGKATPSLSPMIWSIEVGADQLVPLYVEAYPPESTAIQKVPVGHETAVSDLPESTFFVVQLVPS
jgi:hypothetical protein